MKNSLRHFREEKGLSLRALGELSGVPFQSIGYYETNAQAEVPNEVWDKLAKALDVSKDKLRQAPRPVLSEDAPLYRANVKVLPMGELPTPLLEMIYNDLLAGLPGMAGEARRRRIKVLDIVTAEIDSRGQEVGGAQVAASSSERDLVEGIAGDVAAAEGEPGQSEQSIPTGERAGEGAGRRGGGGHETKRSHPTFPTKGKK